MRCRRLSNQYRRIRFIAAGSQFDQDTICIYIPDFLQVKLVSIYFFWKNDTTDMSKSSSLVQLLLFDLNKRMHWNDTLHKLKTLSSHAWNHIRYLIESRRIFYKTSTNLRQFLFCFLNASQERIYSKLYWMLLNYRT